MTGDADADRIVADAIFRFGRRLPAEAFSLYLCGSFAVGEGDTDSDVDLTLVCEPEAGATWQIIGVGNVQREVERRSGGRAEIGTPILSQVQERGYAGRLPGLKLASRLVVGEDGAAPVLLPPFSDHIAGLAERARSIMMRLRGGAPSTGAVELPDAGHEFGGYTLRRTWYSTETTAGTREMVDLVAALAVALAASTPGHYVTGKRAAVELYRWVAEAMVQLRL